jgi:hypothetical protein
MNDDPRPWLQTFNGRAFPLIDPDPSDVCFEDIAYALAHVNRFCGHAGAYSVAQHSIVVADQLRPEWRVYGLLHDAHEAFLCDVPTPLKKAIGGNMRTGLWGLSDAIDKAILRAADLCYPVPQEIAEAVHIADVRALVTERRDLMREPPRSWGEPYDSAVPLPDRIIRWTPQQAMARFTLALGAAGVLIGPCTFVAA